MEAQKTRKVATSNTIKLDIDSQLHIPRIVAVKEMLEIDIEDVTAYKTKHGWHVYLKCPHHLADIYLPFVQCAMGSDYKRECLNMVRVLQGSKEWNVLFAKKFVGKTMVSKEVYDETATKLLRQRLELK